MVLQPAKGLLAQAHPEPSQVTWVTYGDIPLRNLDLADLNLQNMETY